MKEFIYHLLPYFPVLGFLIAFLFGYQGIVVLACAHASGLLADGLFLSCTLCGMLASDLSWFFLGRHQHLTRHISGIGMRPEITHALLRLKSLWSDRLFLVFLLSKFLYGTRTLTAIYMGTRQELSYRKFVLFSLTASALFVATVSIAVRWISGRIAIADTRFGQLNTVLLALLVFFGLSLLIRLVVGERGGPKQAARIECGITR